MADDEGSNKEGKGVKAMATTIRVGGNKEGDGIGNEGGVRVLGLLANLKETREVKGACQVEATRIRSLVNE